jgi:hypothetical protein
MGNSDLWTLFGGKQGPNRWDMAEVVEMEKESMEPQYGRIMVLAAKIWRLAKNISCWIQGYFQTSGNIYD